MKIFVFGVIAVIFAVQVYSQNLVSPLWHIESSNEINQQADSLENSKVNLLLSWERQGYSWMNSGTTIKNTFHLQNKNEPLQLNFSLQAKVEQLSINGHIIGATYENTFWTNRGKKTLIVVDTSILNTGRNTISFKLADLSYTGGKSHNIVELHEPNTAVKANVEIAFLNETQIFDKEEKPLLKLATESSEKGQIHLKITNDFHAEILHKTIEVAKGSNKYEVDLSAYNLTPGFYESTAILSNGTYAGTAKWFAVEPEKISCNHTKIDGFDTYWQNAMQELQKVKANFKMHKVDSLCSEWKDGFVVEMQSLGNLTIRGYYFVPKGIEQVGAVLHLPGYSYGFEYLNGFINRKNNVAELAICVRGHGISSDVFDPWKEQTLWSVGACNLDSNIYKFIYMDCLRAVDFLFSRPEIDKSRVAVVGGSQGGGLALATAGMYNDKIAACAFFDPFLCDIKHQTEIRTIVQNEFKGFTTAKGNNCSVDQIYKVQEFNDTKNFASKIKCPTTFISAFFDDDCPVHCGFAAYNLIKANKKYIAYPNNSHLGESGEYDNLYFEALKLMN